LWPERGQSAMDVLADGPPVTWAAAHDDGTLRVIDDLEELRQKLCADVEPQHAYGILRRFRPQSLSSVTAPSDAPERGHPATYVICERDQALPLSVQERVAAAADHHHRLPSSHAPMASMPDELADLLDRVR